MLVSSWFLAYCALPTGFMNLGFFFPKRKVECRCKRWNCINLGGVGGESLSLFLTILSITDTFVHVPCFLYMTHPDEAGVALVWSPEFLSAYNQYWGCKVLNAMWCSPATHRGKEVGSGVMETFLPESVSGRRWDYSSCCTTPWREATGGQAVTPWSRTFWKRVRLEDLFQYIGN